jgi:hypothetical protein
LLRTTPPLVVVGLVLLLLLALLPSALNLPQSNPTQTPEYAPVPPKDETAPPSGGNLSSLGLAGSSSLSVSSSRGSDTGPTPLAPGSAPSAGAGKSPTTKRCYGNPPRQSEDRLAPPCVANFSGDNFGSTYAGVTAEEIRVLIYLDGNFSYVTSNGPESPPSGRYFDLADPPNPNDHVSVRGLRGYQRYFNERYQTYGRFVHFFAYYANTDNGVEARRADAVDNLAHVHPFAVVNSVDRNNDAYTEIMARHGVLTFGSGAAPSGPALGVPAAYFRQFPRLIWSFRPSLDQLAHSYASFVCRRVVGRPVTFSGNGDLGQPRKLGVIWGDDDSIPLLRTLKNLVEAEVKDCGGQIADEVTFPTACCICCGTGAAAPEGMARFRGEGITTILWPGGLESEFSKAAGAIGYKPEWVLLGDHLHDTTQGSFQDPSVWSHAWVVTPATLAAPANQRNCFAAFREADPNENADNVSSWICPFYEDLRQLFTGIQVAGPRLGPTSMDRGFHAIPAVESDDPTLPACFYETNDYTCVKDAVAEWWDPQGTTPGAQTPGCWRMPEGGRRFLARTWPSEDAASRQRPDDVCNAYDG